LKTLFSDIAPIKNAFVVLEKETKVSKGVGYVTFAMREDASQCVEKGSVEMNRRILRVTWADAKVRVKCCLSCKTKALAQPKQGETEPVKHAKLPKRANITVAPKAHDTNAVRTVTLSGLPADIDSKAIWKKVRKQSGADSVEYPAVNQDGSEDGTKAHVLYKTPSDAQYAIERLNAHVFKGSVLGATLKKRLEKRPNRASRLIVRNLPWDATESELRKLFLPHGVVYSVEIPTEPWEPDGKHDKPKTKGFAFIWMLTKQDAEAAISKVNGSSIKDRTVAVDWALSKEKWLDAKEKMEEEIEVEVDNSDKSMDEDDDEDGLGVHSDRDISMHSQDDDEEESEDPTKPELPPPEAGTTLFIRNVPWEATEEDLRHLYVPMICRNFRQQLITPLDSVRSAHCDMFG
jgi:nucleolar protein 4